MREGIRNVVKFTLSANQYRMVLKVNKAFHVEQLHRDKLGNESWQDVEDDYFTPSRWAKLVCAILETGSNKDLGSID